MIEALEIEFFEAHENTIIEFHPKFNVIVGTTNHGKSSIIRALKWNITNKPSIDWTSDFITKKGTCRSSVQYDDGFVIRERRKAKNKYTWGSDEGEDDNAAFGKGEPPDEIKAVTRMDDRNIKSQHDKFFMFQDSPGEVARKLNKIVGNEDINVFFKRIDSIILTSDREAKRLTAQISNDQQEVESLSFIDEANSLIEHIDALVQYKKDTTRKMNTLVDIVNKLKNLHENKKKYEAKLKYESQFKKMEVLYKSSKEKRSKLNTLVDIVDRYKAAETDKEQLTEYLELEKASKHLFVLFDSANIKRVKHDQLSKLCQTLRSLKTNSKIMSKEVSRLDKLYTSTLKRAKICPVCGQNTEGL